MTQDTHIVHTLTYLSIPLSLVQVLSGRGYEIDGYDDDFTRDDIINGDDDFIIRSLTEMADMPTRYQSHTLHCAADGDYGFTLRHFSIQPNAGGTVSRPHPLDP